MSLSITSALRFASGQFTVINMFYAIDGRDIGRYFSSVSTIIVGRTSEDNRLSKFCVLVDSVVVLLLCKTRGSFNQHIGQAISEICSRGSSVFVMVGAMFCFLRRRL